MATVTAGVFGVDMDQLDVGALAGQPISINVSTTFTVQSASATWLFNGAGLSYGASNALTAGTITAVQMSVGGQTAYALTGLNVEATTFFGWVATDNDAAAKITLLAGDDSLQGSSLSDRLRGYAGADSVQGGAGDDYLDGGAGDDSVAGGAGDDVVVDAGGRNYLRGDDGNDYMLGGADFDDLNGNAGADTVAGGFGDDWVVGGKDGDQLRGDEGADIVYGNLGDDICDGGDGADLIRGGQGNDVLVGGSGNDWLSGDRGDDTVTGGTGADIFHSFGDAGIDRVLDFSLAQGDRVQLDPGTSYTVTQVGADTVIGMSGGQLILVGVSMSSLTASTIFLA